MFKKSNDLLSSLWNQLDRKPTSSLPHLSTEPENESNKLLKSEALAVSQNHKDDILEGNASLSLQGSHRSAHPQIRSTQQKQSSNSLQGSHHSARPQTRSTQQKQNSNSHRYHNRRVHHSNETLSQNIPLNSGRNNLHALNEVQAKLSSQEPIYMTHNLQKTERVHNDHCRPNKNHKPFNNMRYDQGKKDLPNMQSKHSGNSRVLKPFSFTVLQELTTKDANEILLRINSPSSPFSILLNQNDLRIDMMALVLVALGKSCSATLHSNIGCLLSRLLGNTEFLLCSVPKYLVSLRQGTMKPFHLDSLLYLALLLQKFQHSLPSSSSETISILLPLLKIACDKFLTAHSLQYRVPKIIDEVNEQNELFLKEHTPQEIKKISQREKDHLLQPPDNYRSIPVLPTAEDVQCPVAFLRANLVEGKYSNLEHYLDVQYRLLREDYVRPLREGIADYLQLKKQGKSVKKVKDVRVYTNVHIVKQDFINGGMVHFAEFPAQDFSKVRWEFSKRLLSGSLLCFSSDDFKTMLFASVALRDPEQLKKGLLLIRFEEITDEVLNLTPLRTFVVIETTAYFEAYRYNLKALCEINTDNLPFQKYIVDVKNIVECPKYLHQGVTYDFRPLLIPLEEKHIKHTIDTDGDYIVSYEFPNNISKTAQTVRILEDSAWPSRTDLNLDHSQFRALKAAITKEFTIIQGPPGTGKTYVGLRIVQLLLHNLDKWFLNYENSLPILVVCYTNHALDQFLEGLMLFTRKIVRIGGRGTNDAVAQYQLSNLKKLAISKKEIPKYINMSMWEKNNELRAVQRHIDEINKAIQKSTSVVLGEYELQNSIPDIHYESLKSIKTDPIYKDLSLTDDGCIIHDWLGVRSRLDEWEDNIGFPELENALKAINKPTSVFNSNQLPDIDDEIEDVGEADIEFIEAQRDIDREEFAEISFDIEVEEEKEFYLPSKPGWKTQGGKKSRMKYIRKNLLITVPFEESIALKIRNVWILNVPDRWRLYRFWLDKYIAEKQVECMIYQQSLKVKYKEVCEMRTETDIFILNKAHIVGMTTTGAAKYRDIVVRLNPQILIVEEAAEILESHIVTSLAPKTQHVILIGDHQQLRPSPTVHALAVNYGLNISLFERMLKNSMECFRLSVQHRMRPEIAQLIVPSIYPDLENHDSVTKFEKIRGVQKNVFFLTHTYNELQESDSKSKVNEHEAKFLIKLCRYFVLQGYDPSNITVLTTYSGQLFAMKNLVKDIIKKVKVTVVDNYQGEENDIILISFVRSNEEGEIGFLKVSNRVCVALSRARKGLFCIGNFGLLAEKSLLWKQIVNTLVESKAIGSSLQLVCENHPGVSSNVSNEKEFELVAEGGCSRMCEYRLPCGHVCSLMCHPYDKDHENIRCFKKCNKICEMGHECSKKCYQECGPCLHKVDKYLSDCGHTVKIPCHRQSENILCDAACDKFLPCNHRCSNICSEPCTELCTKIVISKCPVGHEISLECHYSNDLIKQMKCCKHPCNAVLSCGHTCRGNCFQCFQGRLHVSCNKPCKRILVCGHECKSPCCKSCPPCKLPCENRCVHSVCPKTCGEPCEKCIEPCEWSCTHITCPKVCGDPCDRPPCNKPCLKLLPCQHPCIGFCGETCPDVCRECDSDTVQSIFFGTEDDDNARFVQLQDCKHVLEISGLFQWMENDGEGDKQIQLKTCPKCKTVIRQNLRFGNIVKNSLRQIEKVKCITYGNVENNKEAKKKLLLTLRKSKVHFTKMNKTTLFETWVKFLSSMSKTSIQKITTLENVFEAFVKISSIDIVLDSMAFSKAYNSGVNIGIQNLCIFMSESLECFLKFIEDEYLTASEQQLEQLTWEIHRFKLGGKFLKFFQEHTIKSNDPEFNQCLELLTKYKSFSEKDCTEFCTVFQRMTKRYGTAVINLSDLEKTSILKAMGLSRGHWYQCPNGHVYCITECGGAMVESKCNECDEKIGGTSHNLLRSNRVARDMDGATHSAWSDAANMGNYQF